MWGGRKHCHPVWPHATEVALGHCLAVQLLQAPGCRTLAMVGAHCRHSGLRWWGWALQGISVRP